VVVVNHALLLSDPGLRSTLIAEAGSLVLDEAHHLERVAREQLGVSLGVSDLTRLAARTDARGGALRLVSRALRRGRRGSALERIAAADAAIRPVLEHAAALTRELERLLPDGSSSVRLTRETDWAAVSPAALDQLLAAIGGLARLLEAAADAAEGDPQSTPPRQNATDAVEELRARHATWIEVEQALRAVTRLEAAVAGLATSVRRNVLALLTSYQMLDQLAARIRAPLLGASVRLLTQAPGEAAAPLAREFRAGEGMVLLGAASFWEGVDFPGAALEILVIARLPFPVPTDPVVAARSELM